MRNIVLVIEYDGTDYCGWQRQKHGKSIQETIQEAIEKITGSRPEVIGSGRTDAGVHAKALTANFHTESKLSGERFAFALNAMLPRDIVIKSSREAEAEFHSRYHALGKRYSYLMLNSRQPTAIYRNQAFHVSYCDKLDIDKMVAASQCFVGTHDFAGFMSSGSSVKDTVRTIYSIQVTTEGEFIKITYEGNGFLYNMIRILSGTLLYVGIGKIKLEDIPDILASKDRTRAGKTLPPHGLYLEKVIY